MSGVRPCLLRALTSAPLSTSRRAFRGWPPAQIKAVASKPFFALTSAPESSSSCTASVLPNAAA